MFALHGKHEHSRLEPAQAYTVVREITTGFATHIHGVMKLNVGCLLKLILNFCFISITLVTLFLYWPQFVVSHIVVNDSLCNLE